MYGANLAIIPPAHRRNLGFGVVRMRNGLKAMTPVKSFVASGLGGVASRVKYANVSAAPCVIADAHESNIREWPQREA